MSHPSPGFLAPGLGVLVLVTGCGGAALPADALPWLELAGFETYVTTHVDVIDVREKVVSQHTRRGGLAYVGLVPRRVAIEDEEGFGMAVTLVHEAAHHEQWGREGRATETWATLAELAFLRELRLRSEDFVPRWQPSWDAAAAYGELSAGDGGLHHGAFGLTLIDGPDEPAADSLVEVLHSNGGRLAWGRTDASGRLNFYLLPEEELDIYAIDVWAGDSEPHRLHVHGGGGEASEIHVDLATL